MAISWRWHRLEVLVAQPNCGTSRTLHLDDVSRHWNFILCSARALTSKRPETQVGVGTTTCKFLTMPQRYFIKASRPMINPIDRYPWEWKAETRVKSMNFMGKLQLIEQLIGIVSNGRLSQKRYNIDSYLRNF